MLPRKFHFYAFSFVMPLLMSGVMSLELLFIDHSGFFKVFPLRSKMWGASMIVAFPVSLFVVPVICCACHSAISFQNRYG